ncbi:hypothetical protein ACPXB5_07260 [Micromonospora arida]|uniref:hypothetical protein n=1 Tax=Micromonospora arida TaxID=2203715 RepID=UPI003CF7357C
MANGSSSAGNHWLYQWIDEYEAKSVADVADRMKNGGAASRLQELAARGQNTEASDIPLSLTVVAGPGLEPEAPGMCADYECQQRNIDLNFGNVLHYFDYVTMEGPSARLYNSRINNASKKRDFELTEWFLGQDVLLLNHIRNIGLADYVVFSPKACYCRQHLKEKANDIGLAHLVDDEMVEDLAKLVSREGNVHLVQDGPRTWYASIRHPLFDGLAGSQIRQKTRPKKTEAAASLIRNWLSAAVIDAATARGLEAPLASFGSTSFFDRMQAANPEKMSIDDVGARIKIPALVGLSTKSLIELRNNEYHHFEKFRGALREAIAETIEKSESDSPDRVAEMVWQSKIRPAVADIERKIAASDTAFRFKLGAAVGVGSIAAAIGLVASLPWLIGVGTLAAATPLPQFFKATEDRQQIKSSDMYFLWKAKRAH